MNYLLLVVGAALALANTRQGNIRSNLDAWESFKVEHGKNYGSTSEESLRQMIFAHNKQYVEDFNAEQSAKVGFELGLNHLSDLSELEMKAINGFRLPENHEQRLKNSPQAQKFLDDILNDNSFEVPDEVDWRKVPGRVTRIKDQGTSHVYYPPPGQCGSCWAFATTGVLEGQEAVRKGNGSFGAGDLIELSEQNLVDCVTSNAGCSGGLPRDALDQVSNEGGIDDEESYPYETRNGICRFNKNNVVLTDAGAAILPQGDEETLKKVVAKFGPVAVAIDASSRLFQLYKKGVYINKQCDNKADGLDHAVLVVGYGSDPRWGDYWLVKNSWGSFWGEHGYIRMARNLDNQCGIATEATIPTF